MRVAHFFDIFTSIITYGTFKVDRRDGIKHIKFKKVLASLKEKKIDD